MNENDPIPANDQVARHVKGSQIHEDGTVDADAFNLATATGSHEYCSVNWLEQSGERDEAKCIALLKKIWDKKQFKRRANHKFAVANVGELIENVQRKSADKRILEVLYKPYLLARDGEDDESHTGILGYSVGEVLIATYIAETFKRLHEAL